MSRYPDHELQASEGDDRPIELVLQGKPRDLGGFSVRRTLPCLDRRSVGPFVFWDHLGPADFEPDRGIDVRPHPHIGLATVTYLFEGEIVHKDTLGSDQPIRAGAVNWMTAGRGIAHSERTSPELRRRGGKVHGIQSWVALPREHEETDPSFQHHAAGSIPETVVDGVRLRVLAGSAYGLTSPFGVLWPTLYVEAVLPAGARLVLPDGYDERAAYVVAGSAFVGKQHAKQGEMLVAHRGAEVALSAEGPAHVMLLGGAPLDAPRHVWWNFVSSSKERIEQAKRDWVEGRFGKVPGDETEFIPLPT